jgi:alpha-beta hydrolase superfamily lysophospholipase
MEFNIKLSNGQILRGFIKSPGDNIRAVIILVHGVGDHIERFREWAELFAGEKIGFAGVDLPGHGASDGRRGHIKSYGLTDEMITILLNESKKTFPGIPQFLYGHSMGGGIVLDYLIRKNPSIRGGIVTSPWLKLAFEPDRSKLMLAAIVGRLFPGLIQQSGLVVEHISHDTNVVEKYRKDPLIHDKISLGLFNSAFNAARKALENASDLKLPVLLLHGSDDLICSPEGSKEFASKTKMAQLKVWDGGYHELHNELFKDKVFSYIISWINTEIKS